jgi:hypothetical protein
MIYFLDGVKPSICAYTSLFAATYMATQPSWDSSYGTEYCTNIEKSASNKILFINSLLGLDPEKNSFVKKC